jgi:argininosuccinate lyase
MAKVWQGRLPGPTDPRVEAFTESISFDQRLAADDIRSSIAHATMLAEVGLISSADADAIAQALTAIGADLADGRLELDPAVEDIHLLIEGELIRRLGDVGRKLHTARSRNDQVATDLKLWIRRNLDLLDERLITVQKALLIAAERDRNLILPGYTHLQRAQPVLAAHYFLAYVEKYERDRGRLRDCRGRLNVLPLGAGALAGTSLPIDRHRVAQLLGFDGVTANSLDTAGDRDFVLETVFVLALIAEHLSGWAEEWIVWSTTEFGFLRLPDGFCTGSSIMPHKKNADVLELIRGKSARVIGALTTLLIMVKGLPLAYNRDLQEDKPALFDAMETVLSCVELAAAVIAAAEFDRPRIAATLEKGFLDATTLMERLVALGVPMRSAHQSVGQLVRAANDRNCTLAELDLEQFEALAPGRGRELHASLGIENAVAAFVSYGSTGPAEVNRQLETWKRRLGTR